MNSRYSHGLKVSVLVPAAALILFGVGAPALGSGDYNGDGDVGLDDFAGFAACMTGPGDGLGVDCEVFDFDVDQDVDVYDFRGFQCRFGKAALGSMKLIPGGEFTMGCHEETGEVCEFDELPLHAVYVDSFDMDVYEVTNRQYCVYLNSAYGQGLIEVSSGVVYKAGDTEPYCDTFAAASDSRIHWDGSRFGITPGKEDHPMVFVSWYGVVAYANWRSTEHALAPCYDLDTWECEFNTNGYRLPTEAEWEHAARGGAHDPYYAYPWGNSIDGSKANYRESGDPYETGAFPWTTPVGYYDGSQTPPGVDMANGYELYDMAGNVDEWCNDWYSNLYYEFSPYDNPQGPASGTYRVQRGGVWSTTEVTHLRCARRNLLAPGLRDYARGFRVGR